jgi:hypothetical protein
MDEAVAYRYQEIKHLAIDIVGQLRDEVVKLGFKPSDVKIMNPQDAKYRLEKD